MTRRAKREGGLLFINVGDPTQLRDEKQRRRVRSHVSALQHELRRRDHRRHPAYHGALLEPPGGTAAYKQAVPHYYPTSQYDRIGAELSASATATEAPVAKSTWHHHSEPASSSSAIKTESTISVCTDENQKAQASTPDTYPKQLSLQTTVPESTTWRHRHAMLSSSSQLPLYAGLRNPLDKFDRALQLLDMDLQKCLDHQSIANENIFADIAAYDSIPKEDLRKFHASLMTQDPTYRVVVLLVGAASLRHQDVESINTAAFHRLLDHALQCIQADINSAQTSLADSTFISVCALAWYESRYGSRHRYEVHMRGLATMLEFCTSSTSPCVLPCIRLVSRRAGAQAIVSS